MSSTLQAIDGRRRAIQPVSTSTLVAAWQQPFEFGVAFVLHRAAAVSASTLANLGHTTLARRSGQWILDPDPSGVAELRFIT